jgi:hypothetical protein
MKKRRKKNQRGQAIIEFVLVFMILMAMIFVVVQMAWGLAFGHYVHYSTYMAARAYLSAGKTKQDQADAAKKVLEFMVKKGPKDIFPFIAKAREGEERDVQGGAEDVKGAFIGMHPKAEGQEGSRFFSWAEGVQYNFQVPLYLFPLGFMKNDKGKTVELTKGSDTVKSVEFKGGIPFTSDAWLGREVSNSECIQDMERLSATPMHRMDGATFLEDNGC